MQPFTATTTRIIVESVRKQAGQSNFSVHPRRWVVERFLAWFERNCGLAKDCGGTLEAATDFLDAGPFCCFRDESLVRSV
jgi:transposase